jgi:hypothetical protein
LAHFPDFPETPLKVKWLPAAYQNSSVKIREMFQPRGRGKSHSAVFKGFFWQIQKFLKLSGKELINPIE